MSDKKYTHNTDCIMHSSVMTLNDAKRVLYFALLKKDADFITPDEAELLSILTRDSYIQYLQEKRNTKS